MLKYLTPAEFRYEARHGRAAGAGVQIAANVRAISEKLRTASFIFSTGAVDRAGDRIDPAGWVLSDFRRNPVALFAHNSRALPIGRARNVRVGENTLLGDIEFADADISSFADQCWRIVRGGFMPAVSVGFAPLEWSWARDPARPGGIDFRRQALLEISCVPVPAHPGALLVGASMPSNPAPNQKARQRQRGLELARLRYGAE